MRTLGQLSLIFAIYLFACWLCALLPFSFPASVLGMLVLLALLGRWGRRWSWARRYRRILLALALLGTLLFLLNNDAAGFITGVVIPVDGGFSAYSGV